MENLWNFNLIKQKNPWARKPAPAATPAPEPQAAALEHTIEQQAAPVEHAAQPKKRGRPRKANR